MPRLTSFAGTSAAFTAFTTASGWRSLSLSAPGSPCNKARTADASNTGLLALSGFTRRLHPPIGDQLVRQIHALGDVLAQESPGTPQSLFPGFHDQCALLGHGDAQLG